MSKIFQHYLKAAQKPRFAPQGSRLMPHRQALRGHSTAWAQPSATATSATGRGAGSRAARAMTNHDKSPGKKERGRHRLSKRPIRGGETGHTSRPNGPFGNPVRPLLQPAAGQAVGSERTHHGNILQKCHTGGCAHTGRPVASNSACGPTAMFCTISFAMPAHFCKFAARQEIRHTHACNKH